MYVEINNDGHAEVCAEESDICYSCLNIDDCPLVGSLLGEVAVLRYGSVEISQCKLCA